MSVSCRFAPFAAPLDVEDLETLLHERMLLSFNTEIEDGSIEEVLFYFPLLNP